MLFASTKLMLLLSSLPIWTTLLSLQYFHPLKSNVLTISFLVCSLIQGVSISEGFKTLVWFHSVTNLQTKPVAFFFFNVTNMSIGAVLNLASSNTQHVNCCYIVCIILFFFCTVQAKNSVVPEGLNNIFWFLILLEVIQK